MKRLIYQVAVGNQSRLYDYCTNTVKQYSIKYNIDYIKQTEPILKIMPDILVTNRSKEAISRFGYLPIYEKENAFDYLKDYDQIAIIDSDILIKDNSPNIFDELPLNYDFGGVVEREMPITDQYRNKIKNYSMGQYGNLTDIDWKWNGAGAEFINMGLMVFNKSLLNYLKNENAREFISRPEFKKFVDGIGNWKWSTDQTLLNYWIRKENMNIKNMDWKWNCLYKGVKDEALKHAHFIHFFLKDHLPNKGENIEELIQTLG
jgi:hypothetical protein